MSRIDAADDVRRIYTKPTVRRFTRKQREDLHKTLIAIERDTTLIPLSSEQELQLGFDGRTRRGGHRLTTLAFSQIAQLVAPGLSKLLPDVSGAVALPDERRFLIDLPMAIECWNRLVELRFPVLRGYRLIRNESDKRIEGIVGAKHQVLENLSLFRTVDAAVGHGRDIEFYAAQLIGRRLSLWYRERQPAFRVELDGESQPIHLGYYFSNGESTGSSARGTLGVFTAYGVALASFQHYGGRVTHVGKDFYNRFGGMVHEVVSKEPPIEELRRGTQALETQNLGFVRTWTKNERRTHRQRLVQSLTGVGVPAVIARDVVKSAMSGERKKGKAELLLPPDRALMHSGRTVLDLFVPLMKCAMRVDISRREKIEQAAFEILMGRFFIYRSTPANGKAIPTNESGA